MCRVYIIGMAFSIQDTRVNMQDLTFSQFDAFAEDKSRVRLWRKVHEHSRRADFLYLVATGETLNTWAREFAHRESISYSRRQSLGFKVWRLGIRDLR